MVQKQDRERWNDWGIGLLLQGDLKGAEYAFKKVTEAEPEYADGWLNVARALIQEGETDAAKPYIDKALAINPKLGRIYFFKAMIAKGRRRLRWRAGVAAHRGVDLSARPRGAEPDGAHSVPEAPVRARRSRCWSASACVDPEDLQMHYTMMLCYRGLGDREKAGARGDNCSGASRPRNRRNRSPPGAA